MRGLAVVVLLAACGPADDGAGDDAASAAGDCELSDFDGEVLACGTWVREFAVAAQDVVWIAGPREGEMIDVADPPAPGVYSMPREGGEPTLLRSLPVVSHVAAGDFAYYDENDTIQRLADDGAVKTVYARAAAALTAADGWVFWISEGELWGVREPADEGPARLSDEGGAHALFLSARDGRVAWTTDVGELFVRSIESGRPQLLSSELTTVRALAVTSDAVYVAGDAGLQEFAIDGTQPRWVYSTMAVTSVAADARWIAFTPADRSGIELAPRSGGDATRFVDYAELAKNGTVPRDVRIDGDALFWADTRILTHELPD